MNLIRIYKIFRATIVTVLVLVILVPVSLYVAVSLPFVQSKIRDYAEQELEKALGVPVKIGKVEIIPPSQVIVTDATLFTAKGDTIASIGRLAGGVNLLHLVMDHKVVVGYTALSRMDAHIWRDSVGGDLNIQPIIEALSTKDENKPKSAIDLTFNTVIIRRSKLTYNILDQPRADDSRFDPNHIAVSDFRADINIPVIRNDEFRANVRGMVLREKSGLAVDNLSGKVDVDKEGIKVGNLELRLPNTLLRFGDIQLSWVGEGRDLRRSLLEGNIALKISDSYVTPSDLRAFVPSLSRFNESLPLEVDVRGDMTQLMLNSFSLGSIGQQVLINLRGEAWNVLTPDSLKANLSTLKVAVDAHDLTYLISGFKMLSEPVVDKINQLGQVKVEGLISGRRNHATADISATTAVGSVSLTGNWAMTDSVSHKFNIAAHSDGVNIGEILGRDDLTNVAFDIEADGELSPKHRQGVIRAGVQQLGYRGYDYTGLHLDGSINNDDVDVTFISDDPNLDLTIEAQANISKQNRSIDISAGIANFNPDALKLWNKYPGQSLECEIKANISGNSLDDIVGDVAVTDIRFGDENDILLQLDGIYIEAYNDSQPQRMILSSDLVDAEITGSYHYQSLGPQVLEIIGHTIPALHSEQAHQTLGRYSESPANDFVYSLTLKETNKLDKLVKLPVQILAPVNVFGSIDGGDTQLTLNVDAPYLRQGNKLIEGTAVNAVVDGINHTTSFIFDTQIPTAKGGMPLNIELAGRNDTIDSQIRWLIERDKQYDGDVKFSTVIGRDQANKVLATVNILPSTMTFNDSSWTVHPAVITYRPKSVDVDGFEVERSGQFVKIHGSATDNYDDILNIDLLNVNLDYIFESLGLDNVMLGGDATGKISGSGIFTPAPVLQTDNLHVDNISFNRTVLGNADIRSAWNNARKSVALNAIVQQPNDCKSRIAGDIFVTRDSLDIRFEADKIDVGFLQPYMAAFSSEVTGHASGWARLWGNFKYIDLEGDIFADNVMLNIDFTNTQYWATDTVHIRPHNIQLDDITLRDKYGHTAKLNGFIQHTYFKEPVFDFQITDAVNLLAYDVTERINPDWYGHVFGTGTARVSGHPGVVDIRASMKSGPESTFTFVLSDRLDASEYTFITFRDRAVLNAQEVIEVDTIPEAVKRFKESINKSSESVPTAYNLSFDMEINPDLKMILVMDPEGGDRVVAYGSGNLYMGYDSKTEDLVMRGIYTLERGSYNFTLQDIILRDFTINPDSKIIFKGDPYAAQLDLQAVYATNANLSDLDESFLQDKEIKGTRVPVHALLNVTGDMRSPDLHFDLEFPTLTSDVYRKVRSIVSTEEMMNRQIIYLLALNRFYTPDYMANATRGSELVSVASSTLSSQLGSILGQLSDNWTISPNVRSATGDFSDVEFDLALSSQLLNNRLIFNGNLGYRDKTLNTNQFIGDFDIEYLLNRSGNVRLKAYNRYNDKNFYVKTATTTQGVGIIYRRDFDDALSFLHRLLRKKKKPQP